MPPWKLWIDEIDRDYKTCKNKTIFSDAEISERLMRLGREIKVFGIDVDLYPEIPAKIALASLRQDRIRRPNLDVRS
jgi:hypothetical protein